MTKNGGIIQNNVSYKLHGNRQMIPFPLFRKTTFMTVVIAGILLLFSFSPAHTAEPNTLLAEGKKHVLVLHSYHENLPWSKRLMKGLESVLDEQELHVELHVEYMDHIRHGEKIFPVLEDLYRKKYHNISLNLIITTDDIALDFLVERRQRLFPDIPIVFIGPNNFNANRIKGQSNITGIIESPCFDETIELILRLHPHTKRIAVISDRYPSSLKRLEELDSIRPRYKDRVYIHVLTDSCMDDIIKEIQGLPRNTVLYYFLFMVDAKGNKYAAGIEVLERISRATLMPIYTYKRVDVGHGAIGGIVVSGELMAEKGAKIALAILNGKPADDIPIVNQTPTIPVFDYRKLAEFDIPEMLLPENSTILYRPFSFYDAYKQHVWIIISVIAVLLLLIVMLSFAIMQRVQGEKIIKKAYDSMESIVEERTKELKLTNQQLKKEILERKHAEHLLYIQYELGIQLNTATELDRALDFILSATMELEEIDCGGIYLMNRESGDLELMLYRNLSMEFVQQVGYIEKNSVHHALVMRKRPMYGQQKKLFPDPNKVVEAEGIASFAILPVVYKDEVIASLNLGSHKEQEFPFDVRNTLESIAIQVGSVITRIKAEENLRESEFKFRILFDLSPQAVALTNYRTSLINEINDKFCEMSHLERSMIIGKSMLTLGLYNAEDRNRYVEVIEKDGEIQAMECVLHTYTGEDIRTLISAKRIPIQGEEFVLTIFNDVTEMKKLEKQFQQAQKMEAIGTLAGGIAHDFNNLLMGIQGYTSLIMMDIPEDSSIHEKLMNIEKSVQRGADLSRRLLGFARGGRYEPKPTNINHLIQEQNRMFGRTKKEISIHERLQEDIWTVEIDRVQIEQVLLNLYINAWQAMPGGGSIHVETKNRVLDSKFVQPFGGSAGKYICISVTDTGIGMDKSIQDKIFEPFFTTKGLSSGTGLGLASVYGIVKNHDGFITVYSESGNGTTFHIYFPACEKNIPLLETDAAGISTGSGTILLVDDEELILDVGREMLNKIGYSVLTASNGKEAVEIYNTLEEEIDLVIIDMIMPGISGKEAFGKIIEINPEAQVLLSSGYSMNGKAEELMQKGCRGFIQKPFNILELSKKIHEILKKDTSPS